MKAIRTLTILICLLTNGFLFGQTMQLAWDKTYGTGGFETFHQIIQATNGLVVAVGETSGQTNGGSDGLVIFLDYSTGNEIFKKNFGGKNNDVIYGVTQTFDGHFILAGSTESKGNGKSDAWVVKIDDTGKQIWDRTFGGPKNDAWRSIITASDGKVSLSGNKDKLIWSAQLDHQTLKKEKTFGLKTYKSVEGMASCSDGGIVLVGNTGKSKKRTDGDIWLTKYDKNNTLVWERFFGEKGWEEATGIVATDDGGFAVSGMTKSKGEGDLDFWLVKVSREGFQQWDKTFGGKDADMANGICQLHDGGFMISGVTKSHRSGARQYKGFLVKTDAGGYRQWQQEYGGDKEDVLKPVVALYDGNVVAGGQIQSNRPGKGKAWLVHVKEGGYSQNDLAAVKAMARVDIEDLLLNTDDKIMRPGDASFISCKMTNPTDIPMKNVKIQVDKTAGGSGLEFWMTNMVGTLKPKESKIVRIPVKGAKSMATDIHKLNFTAVAGSTSLGNSQYEIQSKKPVPAKLEIANYEFVTSNNSDEITLRVDVANSGDFPTQAIKVSIKTPIGFSMKGSPIADVGGILPRSKKIAKFTFVKKPGAKKTGDFKCSVTEKGIKKIQKTMPLEGGGGTLANGPIMIWTDPAPHELGTSRINRSESFIEFKMTVVSGKTLNPKDFQMRVNNAEMEGSKFNEEDLSPPVKKNRQFTYTYKNKIPLKRGVNKLQVLVDGKKSQTLEVVFEPKRSNLHILAIGPSHPDLKFTGKDAGDFADAFSNQGGASKLFANVYTHKFHLPEKTTLTEIQQALLDLTYMYKDELISPNDVLMVFISSHGKIYQNRFKILQSNYNPKYEQIALDFKSDILESLNQIDCKKLVLLDACHSGAAKSKSSYGALSDAMIDLAKAQPGLSTLTSCRSNELSYENDNWENGAFTEAILEAFSGKPVMDTNGTYKADVNDDGVIRLGELYGFLQVRVPELVKKQLPNAPTSQVPFMPEEQLDKDLPIFYLR